ncbi:hypothetical protein [Halococcus sp. IIIV-5B]|uniref:hypothetical protein n=1 Tax=Halococcus sp. IIIV-5B TaxID=2321230 RepID=UPI0011C47B58|nr:hypothetical protein [Halococcus sp. IIIV-5B]
MAAFVFGVLVAGPGERSSLGQSFRQWTDSIGPGGRSLLVGGSIAAVVVAFLALPIPNRVANGLAVGLLSNVVITVSANYIHAKTVGRSNAA